MSITELEINSKKLQLIKPITFANYGEKTVLTNSSWEYVELWLKRQNNEKSSQALFYWMQAKNLFYASECLPIEARPLTSYYCCLNAAKALLKMRGPNIDFDRLSHGISSDRKSWLTNNIKHATVVFKSNGVLFELSKYFGEEACKKEYHIYDLLYNIPCVHRTFSITYNCTELFIPVRNIQFMIDSNIKKGWVQCSVDEKYSNNKSLKNLPKVFEKTQYQPSETNILIREKRKFKWDKHSPIKERKNELSVYHGKIRKDFYYVFGNTKLWYIKKDISSNKHILNRNSITLIFAVMHWLSELVRYNPEKFNKIMGTKQNWLIHEFVENALYQFVDEISCEITGVDIMSSGYRK